MYNILEDEDEIYYNENLLDVDDIECESDNEILTFDNFYNSVCEELNLVEVDRQSFSFKYKDDFVTGIPIHKIDNNNIIFNIDNKLRKIKLDLIEFE